ncbi:Uncharacterized protein APZ42_005813 [Daphnia magna]|uniref:Uncharacterized protein n=1 Tax=Daphnia magna TaxID=35525 RepID=A0A162D4L0_9CRUS|nr:Uncharacterized protein APZ42_005813 [Daphnia magna]
MFYITGYAIFKYGQLLCFCIDCYTKIITRTCNARYLRLVKHLDRGGLKYPCESVTSRMWTVYIFFRRVFQKLRNCSKIVDDFVDFVVVRLSQCEEFKCFANEKHSQTLCTFLCKKFLLVVLPAEEKRSRVRSDKILIVQNKRKKRKALKLQK